MPGKTMDRRSRDAAMAVAVKQAVHARFPFNLALLQPLHTRQPHVRQWCRRFSSVKSDLQMEQMPLLGSGMYTGAAASPSSSSSKGAATGSEDALVEDEEAGGGLELSPARGVFAPLFLLLSLMPLFPLPADAAAEEEAAAEEGVGGVVPLGITVAAAFTGALCPVSSASLTPLSSLNPASAPAEYLMPAPVATGLRGL